MRKKVLRTLSILFLAALGACNDLTNPTPIIDGTYDYVAVGSLNRRGTLTIEDTDPRTARFDGTFQYTTPSGSNVSGRLIGAFTDQNRIWFHFLTEPQLFHEADFALRNAFGEVFFQGLVYESAGTTFSLRLR